MADDIIEFPKKGAKDDDANRVGIDRDGDSSPLSVSVPELLEGLIRDGMSQEAVDAAYDQGLLDELEQLREAEELAKDLLATFRRRGLLKPARTVGLACIYQGFLSEHWDD
jgi:hypothetical protein